MTVVYSSDRKLYQYLPTAINSLITHNPDAYIYIIAEDDEINCIQQNKNIKIININNYPEFINKQHPNWKIYCGYFTSIKCFLTKIIPDDKILYLDVDTLVLDNLNELWNLDIDNYALAGWREGPEAFKHIYNLLDNKEYINAGVLLMNLKFIKNHQLDDKCINYLNNNILRFAEQDALNIICNKYIKFINAEYNFGPLVSESEKNNITNIKIYHMTREKLWNNPNHPYFKLWQQYYIKNFGE